VLVTKSQRRTALGSLGACLVAGIVTAVSAQPSPSSTQDEVERLRREGGDRIRGATLVGPDDDLSIELANGDLIPVGPKHWCMPPLTRNGLIKVDCTPFDGPAYYFDESTRTMVKACSFWVSDPKRCPPKQWPIDVPGCEGRVPQRITGTWRYFAMPAAGGFSRVDRGWTMAVTDESITFDFPGFASIERAYAVIEQDDQRYSLEIAMIAPRQRRSISSWRHAASLSSPKESATRFSENFADEVGVPTDEQIRQALRLAGVDPSDGSLDRTVAMMREVIEQGLQPLFTERIGPTNVKPRRRRSLLKACELGVSAI
jgi:hypothetical protein